MPVFLQVVGRSGSGKTLAIESATRALRARGLRVAVLKHSHHPIDIPGKDTSRLLASGADPVLISSTGWALYSSGDPVGLLPLLPVDVIFVEGYRGKTFPGKRYVIDKPGDAGRLSTQMAREVHEAGPRVKVSVDGVPAPPTSLWEFVGHLISSEGAHRVDISGVRAPIRGGGVRHRSRNRGTSHDRFAH